MSALGKIYCFDGKITDFVFAKERYMLCAATAKPFVHKLKLNAQVNGRLTSCCA